MPALHAVENPHMVSSRSSVYAVPLYLQVQPTSSHVVLQYMLLKNIRAQSKPKLFRGPP